MHHHPKSEKIRSLVTRNQYLLIAAIFVIVVAIIAVVIFISPRGPSRHVNVQIADPPGMVYYNDTLDILTVWLNFSHS